MAIKPVNLLVTVLGLVAVAAFVTGGFLLRGVAQEELARAAKAPPGHTLLQIEFVTVDPVPVPVIIRSHGFLESVEDVTINAEVEGQVQAKLHWEGDSVEKGDALYQLDDFFKQVDLARAQANAVKARNIFEIAQDELARTRDMFQKDAAGRDEVDARTRAEQEARADLQLAEAALREAKRRLDKSTVKSPIAGRVANMHLEVGEYVTPAQPVAEVIRIDQLKLVVQLADDEVLHLTRGSPARVTTPALPRDRFTGAVLRVNPKPLDTTRKYEVEIVVNNQPPRLLAGMYAECEIPCGQRDNLLLIPRVAVFRNFQEDFCYIVQPKPDGAHAVSLTHLRVAPLLGHPSVLEVIAGLHAGDRVATSPIKELVDGLDVTLAPARSAPAPDAQPAVSQPDAEPALSGPDAQPDVNPMSPAPP